MLKAHKTKGFRRTPWLWFIPVVLAWSPVGIQPVKAQDTQSTSTSSTKSSHKTTKKATNTSATDNTATASATFTSSDSSTKSSHKRSKTATDTGSTQATATTSTSSRSSSRNTGNTAAPPPANSSMVWVNTETKVYHRSGDQWYGKTKQGKYMTESDALAAGYHLAGKGGKGKQ